MIQRLDSIALRMRHQGVARTALWGAHAAATRTVDVSLHRVMKLDVDDSPASATETAAHDSGLDWRFLTAADVECWADDPQLGVDRALAGHIPHYGHLCVGGFEGDRLLAYCWYATGAVTAAQNWGIAVTLPAGAALAYGAFTHPSARGRRVHVDAQRWRLLLETGISTFIATVRIANYPSLRNVRRMGYRDLGILAMRGTRVLRQPPSARALGLTFGEAL